MRALILFDRLKNKIHWYYRNKVFCEKVKSVPRGEKPLIGECFLWNNNVVLGKNVRIWPGATFWGNGEIIIGDNAQIGANTMIYASKYGGGINWR